MGFINKTGVTTLTAYLTQKGREYLVQNNNKDNLSIKYFSLSDPDVNYLAASELTNSAIYNVLPSGYIPDLTGTGQNCLKSVAGGISQNYSLRGGERVGILGTDGELDTPISSVGFSEITKNIILTKTAAIQNLTFTVTSLLDGASVIGGESVKIYVLPPSFGTDPLFYPAISVINNPVWVANDAFLKNTNISINFNKAEGVYNGVVKLKMIPNKSVLQLRDGYDVITINLTIEIQN